MKIFGLPIQFLTVVVVSIALTVYLLAAVADARVEARAQDTTVALNQPVLPGLGIQSRDSQSITGGDRTSSSEQSGEAESQAWEHAFLLVCPLH